MSDSHDEKIVYYSIGTIPRWKGVALLRTVPGTMALDIIAWFTSDHAAGTYAKEMEYPLHHNLETRLRGASDVR